MDNINENSLKFANDLLSFINSSPTSFHAVKSAKEKLLKEGYVELSLKDKWCLERRRKYFITKNDSSLIAFNTGRGIIDEGFKIIGSHTDSPTFRIKPSAVINQNGYLQLNTEVYGGPILNTWFDRPLSVAGRVIVKSSKGNTYKTEFINIKEPVFIIPNIAIHMKRESSEESKLNPQKELLPIIGLSDEKSLNNDMLNKIIAKELSINVEDIIDYDLFLYEHEKGSVVGINNEFICASRLDDLAMVHASLEAIIAVSKPKKGISVLALFDNEEIGSSTKQGANSNLLASVLERITLSFLGNRESFLIALENSFAISADMAHSIHPNYPEKCDITNKPVINKGPVIKISASHSYATEADTSAAYECICNEAGVPCQKFVNRSDAKGGSTISRFISSNTNITGMDVGNAMFGMHSIRETAGVLDHYYMEKSFEKFYEQF